MRRHIATIGDAGWAINDGKNWTAHNTARHTVWAPESVECETDPAGMTRIFIEEPE